MWFESMFGSSYLKNPTIAVISVRFFLMPAFDFVEWNIEPHHKVVGAFVAEVVSEGPCGKFLSTTDNCVNKRCVAPI